MQRDLRWFSTEEEEKRLLRTRSASPYRQKRSVQAILDSSSDTEYPIMTETDGVSDSNYRQLLAAIQKVGKDVENIGSRMDEIKGEIHLLHLEKDTMKREIDELRHENEYLHNKIAQIERKADQALEQSHQNAQYSRRNNLRFFGVKEERVEDVTAVLTDIVKNKLKIDDFTPSDIDIAHRLGNTDPKEKDPKPRCIIARFVRRTMRDKIIKSRKRLAGSRMAITDDLTKRNMQLLAAVKKHEAVEDAWPQDGRIMVCIKKSKKIASVSSMIDLNNNVEAWLQWKKKVQQKVEGQPTEQQQQQQSETPGKSGNPDESMEITDSQNKKDETV